MFTPRRGAARPAPPSKPPAAAAPSLTDVAAAMALARHEAAQAASHGEVPVGAVVLYGGCPIAQAGNARESMQNPLAHAEMLALAQAAHHLGRWRLWGCTLVCTLEPCPMCAGALINSRVDRLVFGAWDSRGGAVGSLCNLVADRRFNHRVEVWAGFEAPAAAALLQTFFRDRRRPKVDAL